MAEASGSDPDKSWFESTRGDSGWGRPLSPTGRGVGVHTATVPKRQPGPPPQRLAVCHTPRFVRCDVVQTAGLPAVTRRTLVRPQPSQLIPRSSNGRIFGSEPKDAWFESRPRSSITRTRHGVHAVSNTAAEGSIPSVRAAHARVEAWGNPWFPHEPPGSDRGMSPSYSSRPGRLVGQDAGLSHR